MTGFNEQQAPVSSLASHLCSWIYVDRNLRRIFAGTVLEKPRKLQFKIFKTKSGHEANVPKSNMKTDVSFFFSFLTAQRRQ